MDLETPCQFCKLITFDEGNNLDCPLHIDIFHVDCETCPPLEAHDEVCVACRHLNLDHLLFCRKSGDPKFSFKIALGDLRHLDKVQNCAYHYVIQSSIRSWEEVVGPYHGYTLHIKSHDYEIDLYEEANNHNRSRYVTRFLFVSPDVSTIKQPSHKLISQGSAQEIVDWSCVKGWISSCADNHTDCQDYAAIRSAALPEGFRVVDVYERRLVHPDADIRFVALSYVWGKNADTTQLVTTSHNFQPFQKKNSLAPEKMPRTIEDAIQVCRQLEERYLWVDRLCIIQDDPEDKKKQINNMMAIYTRAAFTLVVACGDDMNAKIPGVSLKRPTQIRACNVGTARVLNRFPDVYGLLEASTWATRGWTLQEKLLSGRKLYVTPVQMVWSCQEGLAFEDTSSHEDSIDALDAHYPGFYCSELLFGQTSFECKGRGSFQSYTQHSTVYNTLDLSHEDDIYNAFSGILNAVYSTPCASSGVIYSLPLRDLDAALLWYPHERTEHTVRVPETAYLPSWSWTSISGSLKYMSFCGTLVKWTLVSALDPSRCRNLNGDQTASYDSYGNLLPWNRESSAKSSYGDRFSPCLYMTLAALQGCLGLGVSGDGETNIKETSFKDLAERSAVRWPTYSSYWQETFGRPIHPSDYSFPNDERWLLHTRAQTAMLRLTPHLTHTDSSLEPCIHKWGYHILSLDGEVIGFAPGSLTLDKSVLSRARDGLAIPALQDRLAAPKRKAMALSIGTTELDLECYVAGRDFSKDPSGTTKLYEYTTYQDSMRTWWDPVPVVNVMFIGERDSHWYRIGIGRVLLRRWIELKLQPELITLC